MIAFGIVIAVLLIVAVVLIGMYNGMVRGRNLAEEAWSGIDVQLKRRHDLIPNLVSTVQGYAAHEQDVLKAVAEARSASIKASTVQGVAQAESLLGSALGCLGRFLTIWATGAVVWGEYMYDIYGLPMTNEWVYSFLYNLPVLVSGVLTVAVCAILYQMGSMRKYLLGQDIK